MEIRELMSILEKYPPDMEVYISGDHSVCRDVVEDMDYCVFLVDYVDDDYDILLNDNMEFVKVKK